MKKLTALFLCAALLAGCAPKAYDGPTETVRVLTAHEGTVDGRTTRREYAYDRDGNCITTYYYSHDKLTTVQERTFDDAGRVLTETETDRSGLFSRKLHEIRTDYDEQGRVRTSVYCSGGKEVERTEYTYDGNTVTKTILPDGRTSVSEYDEKGLILRLTRADIGLETVYTYDAQGRELSTRTTIGGAEDSWTRSEYDDQGRLIRFSSSDPASCYTCTYYASSVTQTAADGSTRTEYYGEDGLLEFVEGFDAAGNQTMKQIYTYEEIRVALREEETP